MIEGRERGKEGKDERLKRRSAGVEKQQPSAHQNADRLLRGGERLLREEKLEKPPPAARKCTRPWERNGEERLKKDSPSVKERIGEHLSQERRRRRLRQQQHQHRRSADAPVSGSSSKENSIEKEEANGQNDEDPEVEEEGEELDKEEEEEDESYFSPRRPQSFDLAAEARKALRAQRKFASNDNPPHLLQKRVQNNSDDGNNNSNNSNNNSHGRVSKRQVKVSRLRIETARITVGRGFVFVGFF